MTGDRVRKHVEAVIVSVVACSFKCLLPKDENETFHGTRDEVLKATKKTLIPSTLCQNTRCSLDSNVKCIGQHYCTKLHKFQRSATHFGKVM